jgi:hypothetical protein
MYYEVLSKIARGLKARCRLNITHTIFACYWLKHSFASGTPTRKWSMKQKHASIVLLLLIHVSASEWIGVGAEAEAEACFCFNVNTGLRFEGWGSKHLFRAESVNCTGSVMCFVRQESKSQSKCDLRPEGRFGRNNWVKLSAANCGFE